MYESYISLDGTGVSTVRRLFHPGHAVGTAAWLQTPGDFEGLQIDDGNEVVAVDRDVGPGTIRLHEDALDHPAEGDPLRHLARDHVEDEDFTRVQIRDEGELAVGRELQPVRTLGLHVDRVSDLLLFQVHDRDAPVARVRGPELTAVRRHVEAFRPFP